jgi:drug/metabolite transporter (DMT)-like permease
LKYLFVFGGNMTLTALGLIVTAAFIHATWNLLAKRASGGRAFVWLYSLAGFILYAPVIVVFVFLDPPTYGLAGWMSICTSGILHLLYSVALQRGYQSADLSVVYPLARGTAPLVSSSGAILLFGEHPTLYGVVGIGLIVFGILLVSGGSRALFSHDPHAVKGMVFGTLTGLFIASYTINDAYAVKYLAVSPILLDYFGNSVRLAFLTPAVLSSPQKLREERRSSLGLGLAVGTLVPLSYILVLFAMRLSPVSYVAPARELSMLIGAFLGARVLHEGHIGQRLIGAALMLVGIVGLAIG